MRACLKIGVENELFSIKYNCNNNFCLDLASVIYAYLVMCNDEKRF